MLTLVPLGRRSGTTTCTTTSTTTSTTLLLPASPTARVLGGRSIASVWSRVARVRGGAVVRGGRVAGVGRGGGAVAGAGGPAGWGGVVAARRRGRGGNFATLVVEAVQAGGLGAVKVEPKVADKVGLVEDGAVGAEEAAPEQAAVPVSRADVKHLAARLGVGVVAALHLAVARKARVGHLGVGGVVVARLARHRHPQHVLGGHGLRRVLLAVAREQVVPVGGD